VARIATWNVRWFPDGKPGKGGKGPGTDLDWLACTLAYLGVDAVALEEIKANDHARAAARQLLSSLNRLSGGDFRLELDDCPNRDAQHVGLLFDKRKVRVKGFVTVGALNPEGEPCKNNLRPGLAAHLQFPGGLDFHLVAVHLKSGSNRRSFELRKRTWQALDAALAEVLRLDPDPDVIVAGDFNTMGCPSCSPSISPDDELAELDRAAEALPTPFRRVRADRACSEYSGRRATLLDHFVVTRATRELAPDVRARVGGMCAEAACAREPKRQRWAAELSLSDHCPVLLDLPDRDQD
jgi:endonuclease/exonuclease/phosphatase family metal-dependent hydrolase